MPDHRMSNRTLDARPDRIDFRDHPYRPPLISLPNQFPSEDEVRQFFDLYIGSGSVRDQQAEGACTGFGLAACIDYIFWDRLVRQGRDDARAVGKTDDDIMGTLEVTIDEHLERVSAFMLYDIAKLYDEWEGEDYSGSSCRGALKGWHKHGVCRADLWRDPTGRDTPDADPNGPQDTWRENAATRPLGAYYRVDARSISDMQAAIHEVRAVYCSARVHGGWQPDNLIWEGAPLMGGDPVPVIEKRAEITGGHAFAMVGYTRDGFIIQNSWGGDWGRNGFALLTYADWIENGNDAWVAALGAPISISGDTIPTNRTSTPLALTATMRAMGAADQPPDTASWSSDQAYDHAVVLGNDGRPLRRRIASQTAEDNLDYVARHLPLEAATGDTIKILIYAHGGLNSEDAAIERAMRLGPWMQANGIYPIFVVWRTSLLETLGLLNEDFITQFEERRDDLRSEGLGSLLNSAVAKLQKSFDKAFEVTAEKTVGKPIWSHMKQNASEAANGDGGTRRLFETLRTLRAELADAGKTMELHVAGHSAGALLLGHMLDDFDAKTPVNSATLLAPACTMAFAIRHFGRAFERKALPKGGLRLHVLSDENERDDRVGPYGKSLLYLVSRALETPRKQPLLGLAQCLDAGNPNLAAIPHAAPKTQAELTAIKDLLSADYADKTLVDVRNWRHIGRTFGVGTRVTHEREFIASVHRHTDADGRTFEDPVKVKATHMGIDNDITTMTDVLFHVLGGETPIPIPIDDLSGF